MPYFVMSSSLQGVEVNYLKVDKQAFLVYKEVKHFKPYLLKSKIIGIVPYSAVRNVLIQKELGEK